MILINEMKRTTAQFWLFSGLLAAALLLGGCAKHESPSASNVASSPSPNSARPTPTPATGDLVLAQEFLNLAAKEFYNRNNRGKSDKKADNSLTNLIEKIGKLANEQ
jgi:hypothetical protein